jgi:hypothetical protein
MFPKLWGATNVEDFYRFGQAGNKSLEKVQPPRPERGSKGVGVIVVCNRCEEHLLYFFGAI